MVCGGFVGVKMFVICFKVFLIIRYIVVVVNVVVCLVMFRISGCVLLLLGVVGNL